MGLDLQGLEFKLRSNLFFYLNSIVQAIACCELPGIYLWFSLPHPQVCMKTSNSTDLIQSELPVLFSDISVVSRCKL